MPGTSHGNQTDLSLTDIHVTAYQVLGLMVNSTMPSSMVFLKKIVGKFDFSLRMSTFQVFARFSATPAPHGYINESGI